MEVSPSGRTWPGVSWTDTLVKGAGADSLRSSPASFGWCMASYLSTYSCHCLLGQWVMVGGAAGYIPLSDLCQQITVRSISENQLDFQHR